MKFIELCCGSSAISMYFLGAKNAIMPYQGSKWKYRQSIDSILLRPNISSIELCDSGPWGRAIGHIIYEKSRKEIILMLEDFSKKDPKNIYNILNKSKVSNCDIEFTAQFLFLQRLSYNGKAVSIKNGNWVSPGFNLVQAYGAPESKNFGKVNPMLPSLISTLKKYKLKNIPVVSYCKDASKPNEHIKDTIVYIDPPYLNTTKYPNGSMSRQQLIDLAKAWAMAGANVYISEAEPIDKLISDGWSYINLAKDSQNNSSFKHKNKEFITFKRIQDE